MIWTIATTEKTIATKDLIWSLWTDVLTWNVWDSDIDYSKLSGTFRKGTKGILKPKNGPKVKFEILECSTFESFTIVSYLPLCKLEFIHQLKEANGQLQIMHKIEMNGPMTFLFAIVLGRKMKVELPKALKKLVEIAENTRKRNNVWTDEEFEYLFVNCLLAPDQFSHEAHIRLAWIHLKKYGVEQAIENITSQIQTYTQHVGVADKYNETLTVASIKIVSDFMKKSNFRAFEEFISKNPKLKYNFKGLINSHYGFDIFNSLEAKQRYIEPDLLPFS